MGSVRDSSLTEVSEETVAAEPEQILTVVTARCPVVLLLADRDDLLLLAESYPLTPPGSFTQVLPGIVDRTADGDDGGWEIIPIKLPNEPINFARCELPFEFDAVRVNDAYLDIVIPRLRPDRRTPPRVLPQIAREIIFKLLFTAIPILRAPLFNQPHDIRTTECTFPKHMVVDTSQH